MKQKQIFIDSDSFGVGDSERCVEIPWALSRYSGELSVLDVGYANAEQRYLSGLLSLNIPNLHGIDLSEKKVEGIISHNGDIRDTHFEDNYFDLVFCISVLEHIGRDNSIYDHKSDEIDEFGDIIALKEIYRITKDEGIIIITLPYGRFYNYDWFIQYNSTHLKKLLRSINVEICDEDYFSYKNGWHPCTHFELSNTLYQDNSAIAAAGLVCVMLKKKSQNRIAFTTSEKYSVIKSSISKIYNLFFYRLR